MITTEELTEKGGPYDLDVYRSLKGKEAFEERTVRGRLPIIDIKGHPFFVDVRLGLLRPMNDFSTMGLEIKNMEKDRVTRQLFFYYHVPTKTQVSFPEDIRELPKDVVGVWVPNQYYLNPVAMARKNGKETARYYMEDGITLRMYRKAKIVRIEKTELAEQVKRNNESKLPGQVKQQQKSARKKTGGKRL